ncbi:MAG: M90 family metallopeptidase [Aquisalimonadaceae bacterium]
MLALFRQWRHQNILRRAGVDAAEWRAVLDRLPVMYGLSPTQAERLRVLAVLFLHERQIVPAAGLEMNQTMKLQLAAQACLPILELGLDWYRKCSTIVLYPGDFVARHRYQDALGLEHDEVSAMVGEAWDQGPVVLSWNDIAGSGERDGYNVVIHEFAHKLDMLNGDANGHPPLHKDMRLERWTRAFSRAYDDFCDRAETGRDQSVIDPYAAESPGEFFSVVSEVFFELPHALRALYPDVYAQLAAFYRQSPLQRLPPPDTLPRTDDYSTSSSP